MKIKPTPERLREIYTNPEFRNQVAHAHGVFRKSDDRELEQLITCSYPTVYIVTREQIEEAKRELSRAAVETVEKNRGKLVLIGMGMIQKEDPELMNNYRVRGYFLNRLGQRCFVEFIQGREHSRVEKNRMLYPDHAMIEGVSIGSERQNSGLFTAKNALDFVNRWFGCDFRELVIDNYTLNPEEITSDARQLVEEDAK